jgi:hypothetical protein
MTDATFTTEQQEVATAENNSNHPDNDHGKHDDDDDDGTNIKQEDDSPGNAPSLLVDPSTDEEEMNKGDFVSVNDGSQDEAKEEEQVEPRRPKRKGHREDGTIEEATQEKEEADEKRSRTTNNDSPSFSSPSSNTTVTPALQVIWRSVEETDGANDITAVQVAVQETAALLLRSYHDLVQPLTKVFLELDETRAELRTLQGTANAKDREIDRLKQSERQARTSIAVRTHS